MHIVVCIKQVPDSAQIRVHPVTNTIMRQGVPTIINPYDLFALEAALRLRDEHGGEVTVLTMGPPMAEDSLRKALSFGADRAVLLTDRSFAGSDTLATSYALAAGDPQDRRDLGRPDIVFTGKQTIDGDTAQVGPGIAKRLDLNQLTYVAADQRARSSRRGSITVERRAEGGVQVLSTKLPCLITMLEGTNEIRRGTIADALRAARAEIVIWSAADAGHRRHSEMRPARLAHGGQARVRAAAARRKSLSRSIRPAWPRTRPPASADCRDLQAPPSLEKAICRTGPGLRRNEGDTTMSRKPAPPAPAPAAARQ